MPLASATRGPKTRTLHRHGRLAGARVEHGAELRVAIVSAGADDDGLARPDRDGRPFFLDQALGPIAAGELAIADELRVRDRISAGREARPDTEHPAGERILADDLVHVAVEDELDALLLCGQLQGLATAVPRVRMPAPPRVLPSSMVAGREAA